MKISSGVTTQLPKKKKKRQRSRLDPEFDTTCACTLALLSEACTKVSVLPNQPKELQKHSAYKIYPCFHIETHTVTCQKVLFGIRKGHRLKRL